MGNAKKRVRLRVSSPAPEGHVRKAQPRSRSRVHGPWRRGNVLLREFVVRRELGKGGLGVVYLVRSRLTGSLFAVKPIFYSSI